MANNLIHIDEHSGHGGLRIALASLLKDGQEAVFDVCLVSDLHQPGLQLLSHGSWSVIGRPDDLTFTLSGVPLYNAPAADFSFGSRDHGLLRGMGLALDARAFVKAMSQLAKEMRDKDETMSESALDSMTDIEFKEWEAATDYTRQETGDRSVALIGKNGIAQVFECAGGGNSPHNSKVFLKSLVFPSGRSLEFTWRDRTTVPKLTRIADANGALMTAEWASGTGATALQKVVVFPGSNEEITCTCASEDKAQVITLKGVGIGADEQEYRIDTTGGKIKQVEVKRVDQITGSNENVTHTALEAVTYGKDGKVATYTTSAANHSSATANDGYEPVVATYTYETGKTTITYVQGTVIGKDHTGSEAEIAREVAREVYSFDADGSQSLTSTVEGEAITQRRNVKLDSASHTATITLSREVSGVMVEEVVQTFDARGNLVSQQQGNQFTEWTYYNDYDKYELTETTERVSSVSLASGTANGVTTAALSLFDYANPIGWGNLIFGSRGLTWSTVSYVRVSTTPTGSHYAMDAFELPVKVGYPGSPEGFSTHLESELVYCKEDEQVHAQRLTYFGYDKFVPAKHAALTRAYVLVPSIKLTVTNPSYEKIDISAKQLEIAKAAAKTYVDHLNARINDNNQTDTDAYKAALASLNDNLKAQSKFNGSGFKLKKPWVADTLQLEDLTYETDGNNAGFGQVKSNTVQQLDAEGNKVAASKVTTLMTYSRDSQNKRKLTVKTSVTAVGVPTLNSSNTLSELSGRRYQTIDSNAISTQIEYDETGRVKTRQVKQGDTLIVANQFSHQVLKDSVYQFDQLTADGKSGERSVWSQNGRMLQSWVCDEGNWILLSDMQLDGYGRPSVDIKYDYDAANKCIQKLQTSWAYQASSNEITTTLMDGQGKTLDSQSVTFSGSGGEKRMKHGSFELSQRLDLGKRTLTRQVADSSGPMLKETTTYDNQWRPVAARQDSVKDSTVTPLTSARMSYGWNGLLSKLSVQDGVTTAYGYDHFGRLTEQDSGGVVINNSYQATLGGSVATEATIKGAGKDDVAISLGRQAVDPLGRLKSRTLNGAKQDFAYTGSSRLPTVDAAQGPSVMKGFTSTWDAKAYTLSESCVISKIDTEVGETATSKTRLSRCGQVLGFTDINGIDIVYTYDAWGRLTKSKSSLCETVLKYADSGVLIEEEVKDLSRKLSMTIAYGYDVSGDEISRSFTCPGMKTLVLTCERDQTGRLLKSVLSEGGSEQTCNAYVYDSQGRLEEWTRTKGPDKSKVREAYTYNVLGRVEKCERSFDVFNVVSQFEFDPKHADVMKNATLRDIATSVSLDDKGALTSSGIEYYPNGQLKGAVVGNSHRYDLRYDESRRLRAIYNNYCGANTPDPEGSWGCQYHYRFGRIYAKTVISGKAPWGQRGSMLMLNESRGCYLQQEHTRELTEPAVDDSSTSFVLRDLTGTAFAAVNGTNIKHIDYSAYGERGAGTDAALFGFKGEVNLPMDVYYLGNYRVYDPKYFSFLSRDSDSPFGPGGPSAYAYCGGDPVNYHDPSGHNREITSYSYNSSYPLMYSREFRIGTAVLGLLLAPFTGGNSLAISLGVTGLAVVAAGFDIASAVLEESDPELARTLGYVGLGFAVASGLAAYGAGKLASHSAGRMVTRAESSALGWRAPKIAPGSSPAKWHEMVPRGRNGVHIWAADGLVDAERLKAPLKAIGRRGSDSDIHIYTGVHGEPAGKNWMTQKNTFIKRYPDLDATHFYYQDIKYDTLNVPFVGNWRELERAVRLHPNLGGRGIHVHYIGSEAKAFPLSVEQLKMHHTLPGHHVHAYCYSLNDSWLRSTFNLGPINPTNGLVRAWRSMFPNSVNSIIHDLNIGWLP
ncbi:hypothetical protein EXN22_12625 [Pseudomonas tructae]|uniref:RHS repeat-associated core domain-containing protein n=1 Tax=Pseudomonas tructae TaxID=2518644 RepID=A0A411MI20_9PSED|nr:RHS repeat-associated core domain-containing protein [Pseudomonas tructae]QBF26496.1 hypothetical protein EXN22_12625 [Pseudomonas tructae]